jgi:hypothetical protein
MYLMRVRLAPRRGSLAAVASLLGRRKVDITRVQTAVKDEHGSVVDFLLELPHGLAVQPVLDEIAALEGVTVQRMTSYRWGGGLGYDLAVLEQMLSSDLPPAHVLVISAPLLLDARWALLLDTSTLEVTLRTPFAPTVERTDLARLAPFDASHAAQLSGGPGTATTPVAVVSLPAQQALVTGRPDGPPFAASELSRLSYLAAAGWGGHQPAPGSPAETS